MTPVSDADLRRVVGPALPRPRCAACDGFALPGREHCGNHKRDPYRAPRECCGVTMDEIADKHYPRGIIERGSLKCRTCGLHKRYELTQEALAKGECRTIWTPGGQYGS